MIEIEVKKQRQLTLKETFEFCLSSIRHRFGRSLLTLSVVVLAVAFFMYLQCSNIFRNSVKTGVETEIIENRKPSKILGMLYTPYTRNEFVVLMVDSHSKPEEQKRMARVLHLSDAAMEALVSAAFSDLYYTKFFQNMPIGKRKELFDRREGVQIFEYLLENGNYEKTLKMMKTIGGIRFPGGNEKFKEFLDAYPKYQSDIEKAYANWNRFQASLKDERIQQNDPILIRRFILQAAADPELMSGWRTKLSNVGFVLTDGEMNEIVRYQTMSDQIEKIQFVLQDPDYRKKWRQVYGQTKYTQMEEKMAILDAPKTMKLLENAQFPGGQKITAAEMKEIAQEFRKRKELRDLELYLDINLLDTSSGFSSSQIFLMALSFLVCVVGITNAMLMSITERFREIATLKCLGATDSFILIQIVLEALIQGVIGSLIGIVLGFLVAMLNSFFQVGSRIFTTFDFEMIGFAALSSLLAGMLLAVLASLYPSTRAARMAPMEAMRVE